MVVPRRAGTDVLSTSKATSSVSLSASGGYGSLGAVQDRLLDLALVFREDVRGDDHRESCLVEIEDFGADQVAPGVTLAQVLVHGNVHRWDLLISVVSAA
jgi:hypothetical protein